MSAVLVSEQRVVHCPEVALCGRRLGRLGVAEVVIPVGLPSPIRPAALRDARQLGCRLLPEQADALDGVAERAN